MIKTREDLRECLLADAAANSRAGLSARVFGDEIWKFIVLLRKSEYYSARGGPWARLLRPLTRWRLHRYGVKLGFEIPVGSCGAGLALPHRGTIVIARGARLGRCCRIHEGVTIGATNGSAGAATVGDNVFIGSGAKIIGEIEIPDNCQIGANAVVVESIREVGTYGGVPARKLSAGTSRANLCAWWEQGRVRTKREETEQ